MEPKYTKAPWVVRKKEIGHEVWYEETVGGVTNSSVICELPYRDDDNAPNAKLISRSPNLLKSLQEIVLYHKDGAFAQHADKTVGEATDGNLTAMEVMLAKAESEIKKATE